jgi:uncharacterized membrane protein
MVDERIAIAIILGMAVVTYLSRIGGVWAMSFVPMTPRIEAALKALSGSVLVALVVPAAIEGGVEFVAAVAVAAVVTFAISRPLIGMIAGVSVAALTRIAI